jgi:hypothetical protein
VIMTAFGGQTEFLPPDLAYLVRYRMVRTPFRPLEPHDRSHRWAEPDVSHAAALMRHVFENRAAASGKARELARRLCETYQLDTVARTLRDCLQRYF